MSNSGSRRAKSKQLSLGNFCLVQKSTVCNYVGDANQNCSPHRHIQDSVPRVNSLVVYLRPVCSLRSTSSSPTDYYRGRIDPRLGLSCGGRGWHIGSTCEATDWQGHYRWSAGPAAGSIAAGCLRAVDQCGPQAQGRPEPASGGVLSRAAPVRSGWKSLFGDEYTAGQKADAQGSESTGPCRISESGCRGDGRTRTAQ